MTTPVIQTNEMAVLRQKACPENRIPLHIRMHNQRFVYLLLLLLPHGIFANETNAVLRGHLQHSRAVFEKGGGTVAFMGGSITEMNGYRPMVCSDLQNRYQSTAFKFIDAGISSTCSTSGAFRFGEHVLAHGTPDLFFFEFAVNDDQDAGHARRECMRGVEGIIRQARAANPNMDIVMVYFVNPGMLEICRAGKLPLTIDAHDTVARHYEVSSIFLAREIAQGIEAEKYTWKDFGGTHPKPFGNRIAADLIKDLLDRAWADNAEPTAHSTPQALDESSYFDVQFLKPAALKVLPPDWKVHVPDWKSLKGGKRQRFTDVPVLETTQAGAELTFEFAGRHVGAYLLAGPDAGTLEASVDDGKSKQVDLYHRYSKGLHYPRTVMFATDLPPGRHRLKLRMTDSGKGTAARIMRFAVR